MNANIPSWRVPPASSNCATISRSVGMQQVEAPAPSPHSQHEEQAPPNLTDVPHPETRNEQPLPNSSTCSDSRVRLPPLRAAERLRAVVLHDFQPQLAGELMVHKGEIIQPQQSVGGGWCVATNDRGAKGLVPESFLRMLGAELMPQCTHAQVKASQAPTLRQVAQQPPRQPHLTPTTKITAGAGQPKAPAADAVTTQMQPSWLRMAEKGEMADHVLVYTIVKKRDTRAQAEQARREEIFEKLRRAGLRVVIRPTPSGTREVVLLTPISQERLEHEAELRKVSMLLKKGTGGSDAFYTDFVVAARDRYALKNGQLFSPLERQRLVMAICEGAEFRGGAEVDLDGCVAEGLFIATMALHSPEREIVWASWGGIRLWPDGWPDGWPYSDEFAEHKDRWPLTIRPGPRRLLPDLGLIQQPLHAVRAYFGSKIAFYFAWAETYTCWLMLIVLILLPLEVCKELIDNPAVAAYLQVAYCVILGTCATLLNEFWQNKRTALAHIWDVADISEEARPRPEYLKSAREGRWRLEEYGGHTSRGVTKQHGFWAEGGLFVEDKSSDEVIVMNSTDRGRVYKIGAVLLIVLCIGTVISTLAILTLQMLWAQAHQFEGTIFREQGSMLGSLLITGQVVALNSAYKKLAIYLTDVENQRIETAYEDSLILKVTLFQFCNSYFALFYIAFVKAQGFSIFDAFGANDRRGRPYKDMCGTLGAEDFSRHGDNQLFVRGDCMDELGTLMLSHLVIKPCIENFIQLAVPWAKTRLAEHKRKRRRAKGIEVQPAPNAKKRIPLAERVKAQQLAEREEELGEIVTEASHDLVAKISDELLLPASGGTFDEFRTKVLQFGYVSMFSVAFPMGAIAATLTNIMELKLDAYKFVFATRRPSYEGADGIGNWKVVLRAYSWIALVINVLVVAYSTNSVRDYLIIPATAELAQCEDVVNDIGSGVGHSLISDEARYFGRTTAWQSSCAPNYRNCFADIGGVPWLPANTYLHYHEEASRPYMDEGLCSAESSLYNPAHCALCRHRSAEVYLGLAWFVMIMEHMLILLKMSVLVAIPNKPAWVRKNEARSSVMKERLSQERLRQQSR